MSIDIVRFFEPTTKSRFEKIVGIPKFSKLPLHCSQLAEHRVYPLAKSENYISSFQLIYSNSLD